MKLHRDSFWIQEEEASRNFADGMNENSAVKVIENRLGLLVLEKAVVVEQCLSTRQGQLG